MGPSGVRVFRRVDDVRWMEVDDEIVLLNAVTDEAFVLTQGASLLWQCLDGVSTLADIIADMADVFATDASELATALEPVVKSWLSSGLVEST